MLGAILGDMVGSIYEFHPCKTKKFDIYNKNMVMTDDSYLTIAIANVLMKHYPIDYSIQSLKLIQEDLAKEFIKMWKQHADAGYGGTFLRWCHKSKELGHPAPPYKSFGNGSAMRISPVGWIANSEVEVKTLSKTVTEITHNHPEGLKGAEAVAMAIYLALHGSTKTEIKDRMVKDYYPEIASLDFDELVKNYSFSEICQESVPQSIYCFLISTSLEDAIRTCIAIGGDCDTTGAMAGAIAEAYYQKDKLSDFEEKFLQSLIGQDVAQLIKQLHKTIGSQKF